eukprot:4049091-Amphidinium_carterae.1
MEKNRQTWTYDVIWLGFDCIQSTQVTAMHFVYDGNLSGGGEQTFKLVTIGLSLQAMQQLTLQNFHPAHRETEHAMYYYTGDGHDYHCYSKK